MAGKISEYINNGNIADWDLIDYSHENEQGSGNWETRSITLAQLQTALGGGGGEINDGLNLGTGQGIFKSKNGVNLEFYTLTSSDNSIDIDLVTQSNLIDLTAANQSSGNPLATNDQTLTGNRIIDGSSSNSLTIKDITSYTLETDQTSVTTYKKIVDINAETTTLDNPSFNLQVTHSAANIQTKALDKNINDDVTEYIEGEQGHMVLYKPILEEGTERTIDSVGDVSGTAKGRDGWHITNKGKRFFGSSINIPIDDIVWSIETDGRAMGLPTLTTTLENNLTKLREGTFWFNTDPVAQRSEGARELSYVDEDNGIRRVQTYGKKGYEVLTVPSDQPTNRWDIDARISYSYILDPQSVGDCDLNFLNLVDGDFGTIIFDLSSLPVGGKFNINLPSNPVCLVVNDGQGTLEPNDFVATQQHTMSWTYHERVADDRRLYITYGLNYT